MTTTTTTTDVAACSAKCSDDGTVLTCERPEGHDGAHVRSDGASGVEWPNLGPTSLTYVMRTEDVAGPVDDELELALELPECAPWCVAEHDDRQHPEDRYCRSSRQILAIKRLHKPVRLDNGSWRWPFLSVSVRREWNKDMPYVVLLDDETDHEIRLGLDEAAGLYTALRAAIDEALR